MIRMKVTTMQKQKQHAKEFKEQVLRRNRERGDRTQQSIAQELNISLGTLKGWVKLAAASARGLPAIAWSATERLRALNESHALDGEALHAWCRQKGLYAHQLQAWREAFCAGPQAATRDSPTALRELQSKHDLLQRQLLRKDKALAEAAALLVLQKKFQALWADEV